MPLLGKIRAYPFTVKFHKANGGLLHLSVLCAGQNIQDLIGNTPWILNDELYILPYALGILKTRQDYSKLHYILYGSKKNVLALSMVLVLLEVHMD